MLKRKLVLLLCALGLMLALGGCNRGGAQGLKDGYYSAEMKEYAGGWKEFMTIRVSGGKIVAVEYNAKNASGFIKAWDMNYMRNMNSRKGTYPNRYTRTYAASLIEAQTPDGVDMVTGASTSGRNFIAMTQALLEKAEAGDTTLAIVELK